LPSAAARNVRVIVTHTLVAVVAVLAVAACSGEANTEGSSNTAPSAPEEQPEAVRAAKTGTAARLVPLAPEKVSRCRRSARLRNICPVLVPRVRVPYLSHLSDRGPVALFDLERGLPGHAPPRGAHITVGAGDVERIDPFEHPNATEDAAALADHVLVDQRREAVSFGRVRWGAREGVLFLAPPFLYGAQLGDHLVFEWGEGDERFLYSLHAWKPLADTAATLKKMVEAAG
jgi:hypothetical protein